MMNSVSDISCVSGQMPRIVGLAYASKLYRNNKNLSDMENFQLMEMRLYWNNWRRQYL